MSIRLKCKTPDRQDVWIVSPDIVFNTRSYNKKINFVKIFCYFGHALIKSPVQTTTGDNSEKTVTKELFIKKKKIIYALDNKVVNLKFFAKELLKFEKILLSSQKEKKKRYNYKNYQIFIGLSEAYLNTIHSIKEFIKAIDESIGTEYYLDLFKKDWFKLNTDLRNLFQHIESPLCSVENNKILLTFECPHKLNQVQFFKPELRDNNGNYQVRLECAGLDDDMLDFLNQWSEKHLNTLDQDMELDKLVGFKKDGRLISKTIKLNDLMDMARNNKV